MDIDHPLINLLEETSLSHGRICLYVADGRWTVTISHFNDRLTHPLDQSHHCPVQALRLALIEDERKSRDRARRYTHAEKLGPIITPSEDDLIG